MSGRVTFDESGLKMPRPLGMSAGRAAKAEIYAYTLYMHGVATVGQLADLTLSPDTLETIRQILSASGYAKPRQYTMMFYRNGQWRKSKRVHAWTLTAEGIFRVERYLLNGMDTWGYSSGQIQRVMSRNTNRYLLMSDWVARLRSVDVVSEWFDVPYWLDHVGIRTKEDDRKLWMERPRMAGALEIQGTPWIGVSLIQSDVRTVPMSVNRMYPRELSDAGYMRRFCLLVFNEAYEERFVTLENLSRQRPTLLVLPYEYTMDRPELTTWLLRGKRDAALRPLIERYERDGWRVERTEDVPDLAKEQYSYRAVRGGEVEFFDSTFGSELMHLYSLLNYERPTTSTQHAPGTRVLYVTSERERDGILSYLRKQNVGKFGTFTEFRLLEL